MEAGDHCHALLLDKYFEKLPPDAFPKDVFYVHPLQNWTPEGPWYSSTPVGKNTLAAIVPKMFKAAGLSHKTNHSLRATSTTALFEANVPEKVIPNSTGHRSLKGLRLYEHVSKDQDQQVSRLLTAPTEHAHSSRSVPPTFGSPNLAFNQQTGFSSLFG